METTKRWGRTPLFAERRGVLRRGRAKRRQVFVLLALAGSFLVFGATEPCRGSGPTAEHNGRVLLLAEQTSAQPEAKIVGARLRIGTFNIRMFPCNENCECLKLHGYRKCEREGKPGTDWQRLADTIIKVRPDILGVNEILDPERFQRFAFEYLGPEWNFVPAQARGRQKLGFLYNTAVVKLRGQKVYQEIGSSLRPEDHSSHCFKPGDMLRPAFACRFEVIGTRFHLYVVVLHLKPGECSSVRRAQWKIMERFVDELAKEDQEIVILGDFNDFRRGERDFSEFCRAKKFTIITDEIACTHMYRRDTSTLDNILVSESALKAFQKGSVRVGGACAESCTPTAFWRAYLNRVSDHCPVVAEFRTVAPR